MPFTFTGWFGQHYYFTILIATFLEGLGLPLPAEALFLAAAGLVHRGMAELSGIILIATLGSVAGSMTGFTLAYYGGRPVIRRFADTLGIRTDGAAKAQTFFQRYGPLTLFLSRFIGFIRAAAIYSAGASRISPFKFLFYIASAALIWNTAWTYLAYHFGRSLLHFSRAVHIHPGLVLLMIALAVLLLIPLVVRWLRRRRATNL